jgi:hypothetical protein
MDQTCLFVPQGNDIVVTARFPGISDGTGMSSKFWVKPDRTTPDTDPAVSTYTSTVVADPSNIGATMSTFNVPSAENALPGAFWWRVDIIDSLNHRRTADSGTYMIESV